jgi:hypothetical protein
MSPRCHREDAVGARRLQPVEGNGRGWLSAIGYSSLPKKRPAEHPWSSRIIAEFAHR